MYSEAVSEILVFKTNINKPIEVSAIAEVLNGDERVEEWNIDQQDVDKVLRIKTCTLTVSEVIRIIEMAGFHCEELMD